MREGWHGDDYLVLLDKIERTDVSARYDLPKYLPGYLIVGLKGWDDFIVEDADGRLATIPTLPIDAAHLAPLQLSIDSLDLRPDSRFRGLVKWHTKPILFGGDPLDRDNTIWVTLEQHAKLVKWWNDKYRAMKR